MALSNEWVNDLATYCFTDDCAVRKATGMIREVESEVRKQDEALIRQMLEALEKVDQAMPFPVARQEITAARARLGKRRNAS